MWSGVKKRFLAINGVTDLRHLKRILMFGGCGEGKNQRSGRKKKPPLLMKSVGYNRAPEG